MIAAGQPAANERVPEFMAWFSNQNSHVFSEIGEFLRSLEHIVVPHVNAVLQETGNLGERQGVILFTK